MNTDQTEFIVTVSNYDTDIHEDWYLETNIAKLDRRKLKKYQKTAKNINNYINTEFLRLNIENNDIEEYIKIIKWHL